MRVNTDTTRCRPNFTVSPAETAKPCEFFVPLVSESVWANAGTAAVKSTIGARQTFTSDSIARPAVAPVAVLTGPTPPSAPSAGRRDQRIMAAFGARKVRRLGL